MTGAARDVDGLRLARRGRAAASGVIHEPLTASQAAATLIAWMGGDWKQFAGAAAPITP